MFQELQKNHFDCSKSVLQKIELDLFRQKNVEVFVKRDDLIHEFVSGNKWRKLKYNIAQAQQNKAEGVFTFGGAFSNHLVATASACKEFALKSIAFVRGEELNSNSNESLKQCESFGMKLIFLDRMTYSMRNDYEFLKELKSDYPNFYAVAEGGANYFGIIGCQEIWNEIPIEIDHFFLAQGTSTTSCGLLIGNSKNAKIHVVPALKGYNSKGEMKALLKLFTFDDSISEEYLENCIFHPDFHFGGYAKTTDELLDFIRFIYKETGIPLDHVYTAKAFFAMIKWIESEENLAGKKIVFLHTGGLQASSFYKD